MSPVSIPHFNTVQFRSIISEITGSKNISLILNRNMFSKKTKVKPARDINESKVIYFPYKPHVTEYVIPKNRMKTEMCEQGLPIPPKDLWLGYGNSPEEYLWGKLQTKVMIDIVEGSGYKLKEGNRILDFGCGAGRMIRWLKYLSDTCEIWGTDIQSEHIYWANQYLKPPFNFATTTTVPHLPFEDRYFNLIYAGSVFTHIDDLADAWLLELRRILNPDGRLFITLHDQNSIVQIETNEVYKSMRLKKFLNESKLYKDNKENFGMIVEGRGPASQVFYDSDFFINSVKTIFEVLSVHKEAYGFQTAYVLKRK